MSEPATKRLVPELRFPEFRDDWYRIKLGKCFTNIGGTALEKHVIDEGTHHFISIGNYSTDGKYIDKGQRVELNDTTKPKLLNKNDLVMVLNDKTLAGDIIGSTLLIGEDNKYIYNQRSERLVTDSELTPIFAWHLLNSQLIRKEVFKRSQGGTQIYVNFPSIKAIKLAIPKDPEEQQKIADCLFSIDALITAHTQKHAALKAHKKGLMQQLFPSEGKTVPKLRFPEFRDAGEWADGVIADLTDAVMGNAFKSSDFVEDGIQLIRMGNLYQGELQFNRSPVYLPNNFNEEYSRFLVEPLDLLMSMTGTVGKRDYGFIVQIPENCPQLFLNQRVLKVVNRDNCVKEFLLQLLKNEELLKELYSLAGGTKQANLSAQQFKNLKVRFPKPTEQQKIADCLSSIDELITAQTQKIESLKTHKKGLMQQLFPATDDDCRDAGSRATQDAKAEVNG